MQRMLMLAAVTSVNRHEAMADINDTTVGCGGWIEGHTLFSNIMVTFRFVVPAGRLAEFAVRVNEAGVHLDPASLAAVSERTGAGIAPQAELPGALAVTFIHDEPDLRREVPAVPG